MATVTDFPQRVVIVLAHTIKHLAAFGIADAFLDTKFFSKFTTRAHMLLAANTLTNLEIYRNETDHSTRGSLMWILDHTKTKFGARLLKSWVGRPLIDKTWVPFASYYISDPTFFDMYAVCSRPELTL